MKRLLETERLILREFTAEDEDDLYRLNSDPKVMRYVGMGEAQSRDQAKTSLQRVLQFYRDEPGYGVWQAIDKQSEQFLGLFLLVPYPETDEVEVGYRFLPDHWGKGYATEGARAVIGYGFDALGLDRIIAIAYPQNKASIRVMEKSGMRPEGTIHNEQLDQQVVYYAIEKAHEQQKEPSDGG